MSGELHVHVHVSGVFTTIGELAFTLKDWFPFPIPYGCTTVVNML